MKLEMAPRKRAKAGAAPRVTRRSARNDVAPEPSVPVIYRQMLAEAAAAPVIPPRKRRKISQAKTELDELQISAAAEDSVIEVESAPSQPQVVYDDFCSDEDDEDAEFEDVDLAVSEADEKPEQKVLTFEIGETHSTPQRRPRRPVVTAAERRSRLEWHKAHFYLLLLSLWCRNRWCENSDVQKLLRPLVSRKLTKLLHEDESKSVLQRSVSFNKGIEDICLLWRTTWTVEGKGARRAIWREDINLEKESDIHEETDFDDFKTAAHTGRGSRDLGAQLFCALLRSVAVECRLVSSLQVLPFAAVAKGTTPVKSKDYTYAGVQDFGSSVSGRAKKKPKESPYPTFWVEVLHPTSETWIPLDPVVRHTNNKPKTGFEPPASDALNTMIYVIAIEDDGSAKDVTRRYSQWFNGKTRKTRVESTKGGEQWMRATLNRFQKPFSEVRDEIEDADLLRRSETEGMPKNIQDFKGHPIYVLERHLRMNEVIFPMREVGKTAIGLQKDQKLESVYRRKDVHLCRTSDAWYRRGRDIKQGEVPLKRVPRKARRTPDPDEDGDTNVDAALYAEYQTEVYEPPPVANGRVPRNGFGNLDLYVSSMIPAGAIHVQHPLAAKAAKLLGIDFVEAVTGFEFKGRQGTAVINGIVVARDVRYGLDAVIFALQNEAISEAEHERSALLQGLWQRWLTALRIRERVQREYGDASGHNDEDEEDDTYQDSDQEMAGGFVPGEGEPADKVSQPSRGTGRDVLSKLLLKGLPPVPLSQEIIVTSSPHSEPRPAGPIINHAQVDGSASPDSPIADDQAGGFLVGEESTGGFPNDEHGGGGFMVDEDVPNTQSATAGGGLVEGDPVDIHANGILPSSPSTMHSTSEAPPDNSRLSDTTAAEVEHGHVGPAINLKDSAEAQRPEVSMTTSLQASEAALDAKSEDEGNSNASLLSHDPEEDDAEPDWLMDSLGD